MSDRIPMTRAGYDKLKTELARLEGVEMPKILARLSKARSEGDLTENAEFDGAKESQGMLQRQIDVIRRKLSQAVLIDPEKVPKDEVAFGATVLVQDLDSGDEERFILVGAGEEDYAADKILVTSPLAQGLMGKKVGDRVKIDVPMGTARFEILEVRYEDP